MVNHLCQSRGIYIYIGNMFMLYLFQPSNRISARAKMLFSFGEGIFDGGFMISFILQGLLWVPLVLSFRGGWIKHDTLQRFFLEWGFCPAVLVIFGKGGHEPRKPWQNFQPFGKDGSWSVKFVMPLNPIHTPLKINGWNTRDEGFGRWLKVIFLFNWVIFMFHVNLPGCKSCMKFQDIPSHNIKPPLFFTPGFQPLRQATSQKKGELWGPDFWVERRRYWSVLRIIRIILTKTCHPNFEVQIGWDDEWENFQPWHRYSHRLWWWYLANCFLNWSSLIRFVFYLTIPANSQKQ